MKFGTSSTNLNKGRKFLSCFGQNGCKGFKWLDELIGEKLQQTAMKKDDEELRNEDDDLLHLKISINKNIEMSVSGSVVAVSKLVKLMSKVEIKLASVELNSPGCLNSLLVKVLGLKTCIEGGGGGLIQNSEDDGGGGGLI
ncbi:hypothetical protein FRX31_019605 [Thalictrum thalictroides]|uniref:Uncharacterized protein n=1 Tax=Thalictrum thalictroides TaxID=46969 RepID=A0A7J6W2R9_THATH|nr:hypothetical protein FRX31_019605 [Thalictrum thalictroides]